MAAFEASNFEAALRHVLQKLVDESDQQVYADVSALLELQVCFMHDLLCFRGAHETQKRFVDLLIRSGAERCLAFCGWMITFHFTNVWDPIESEILFIRKPDAPAVSLDFLKAFLHSALVVIGLPKPVDQADAVKTKIKLWNVPVFYAKLPRNMPVQDLIDIWDQCATITGYDLDIRLVSHTGVTANPDFALRHYSRCGPNNESTAAFSFVGALHGGGGDTKQVSNKQDYHVQQKNALAAFMIRQGADVQDCVRFIDALLKGAGPDAISAILGQKQHGRKWDGLVQLAASLNIPVPDIAAKIEKARKKFQTKFQEQSKVLERDLPIEMLRLQDGFLQNADETSCVQIPKVVPNSSGVVLSRFSDACPWLENGSIISQDELSVIVVGQCFHDKGECHRIRVPVMLHDEPLVLSGCLHHLGAKKAIVPIDDDSHFPVNETQVLAVTAYKDEIPDASWNAILRTPVKQILQILGRDAGDIDLLAPPWGRSYQRNGKRSDVEMSTSVQIHIRIAKEELRRILKASGTGGIYCTPKTEDKRIVSDYMVIWLNQSPVELAVSLSKVDAHCGIIRSSKNDMKNRGIRFEKSDFQHAWSILKPDDKVPQVVLANHHFKVAPTPLGTTAEQLQEWITAQNWEAKPVKPLGGDCWLCVAEKKFETILPSGIPIQSSSSGLMTKEMPHPSFWLGVFRRRLFQLLLRHLLGRNLLSHMF